MWKARGAEPAQVARALGVEASAVTRFADRMVAAGYVSRDDEPGHRDGAILELSLPGEDLVGRVTARREQELTRILSQLPLAERTILTHALETGTVLAGGRDYRTNSRRAVRRPRRVAIRDREDRAPFG